MLKNASGREAFYMESNKGRTEIIDRFCMKSYLILSLWHITLDNVNKITKEIAKFFIRAFM
jgi:hypothetical protein